MVRTNSAVESNTVHVLISCHLGEQCPCRKSTVAVPKLVHAERHHDRRVLSCLQVLHHRLEHIELRKCLKPDDIHSHVLHRLTQQLVL